MNFSPQTRYFQCRVKGDGNVNWIRVMACVREGGDGQYWG